MAYVTADAVRGRARSLSTKIRLDADIDTIVLFSDALIDSALTKRYTVPFSVPVPTLIQWISLNLSAAEIIEEVSSETDLGGSTFSERLKRDMNRLLADLAEGRKLLPGATDPDVPLSSMYDASTKKGTEHVFTRGSELTYRRPEAFDELDEDIDDRL